MGASRRRAHHAQPPTSNTHFRRKTTYSRPYLLSTLDKNNNDKFNSSDDQVPSSSFSNNNDNKKLAKRYTVASVIFGFVSLILVIIPDRTTKNVQLLATRYGGAAGYGLAAATCHLLANAATTATAAANDNKSTHSRLLLPSETSKRLNVGLFVFCFVSLWSVPGEAAFHPKFVPAIILLLVMTIVKMVGCNLAFDGWKAGIVVQQQESHDNDSDSRSGEQHSHQSLLSSATSTTTTPPTKQQLGREFVCGIRSTVRGIVKTPRRGIVYLVGLMLVSMGMFSSLMEGKFYMNYGANLFIVSLYWSAVARLFFISTMVYSLKEAAEDGRLTETTFIQLNLMVALWAFFVAIGQGTYRLAFSATSSPMILMSIPFFYGALRSLFKKSNEQHPPLNKGNGDKSNGSEQDNSDDEGHSNSQ